MASYMYSQLQKSNSYAIKFVVKKALQSFNFAMISPQGEPESPELTESSSIWQKLRWFKLGRINWAIFFSKNKSFLFK